MGSRPADKPKSIKINQQCNFQLAQMANGTRPFANVKNTIACGKVLIVPTLPIRKALENKEPDTQQNSHENNHDQDLDR